MAYNYAWSFLLACNKLKKEGNKKKIVTKETDIFKVGLTHF